MYYIICQEKSEVIVDFIGVCCRNMINNAPEDTFVYTWGQSNVVNTQKCSSLAKWVYNNVGEWGGSCVGSLLWGCTYQKDLPNVLLKELSHSYIRNK